MSRVMGMVNPATSIQFRGRVGCAKCNSCPPAGRARRLRAVSRARAKDTKVQAVAMTIMPCSFPCFLASPPMKARTMKPNSGMKTTIQGAQSTI